MNNIGAEPFVLNAKEVACMNTNYRTAVWTGCYMQMTVMSIAPCDDVGMEIHPDTDQIIRIEQGSGYVVMCTCKNEPQIQRPVCQGDIILVPAGIWHNVINTEKTPLKLSVLYAPPHHPKDTIHRVKSDAKEYGETEHGRENSCVQKTCR